MMDFIEFFEDSLNTYGEPFKDSGYVPPEIEVGDDGSFITTKFGNRVKVCFKVTDIIDLTNEDK